jgi:hypothetical protein
MLLSEYTYRVRLEPGFVRLLKLEPGHNTEIGCEIVERSLDSAQDQYITLSYAWGDIALSDWISCQGQKLAIGKNLHTALWQFRERGEISFIWVDAICL